MLKESIKKPAPEYFIAAGRITNKTIVSEMTKDKMREAAKRGKY